MKPVTIKNILKRKNKKKISVLTAYDYPFGRLADEAGLDIVLVGDSLGMVVLGHDTTLPVTMEDMLRHVQAVRRGVKRALIVADMPHRSYRDVACAVKNAKRFIHEGKVGAVKLEGGNSKIIKVVRALRQRKIQVMGHIGLTPQSIHQLGGYKVQGRTPQEAARLLSEAQALEKAGVFSIVLECVPFALARQITKALRIPTIGIGAGVYCDGQVLVMHDVLGLYDQLQPRFVRRFVSLREPILKAIHRYKRAVENKGYPSVKESFK